ncbi:50S ribosomal protein L13 [archaeon]|nr:50S ribosomal protein L13 [archaeon]
MEIDAKDLIIGRLSTYVAKEALMGEKINILNCDKAVLTGKKTEIFERYKRKIRMGNPFKGPFFPRPADRIVRRLVRGMLPFNRTRGRDAFKRVMCYIGIPEEFKDKKLETFDKFHIKNTKSLGYVTVGEISEHIGAKKNG